MGQLSDFRTDVQAEVFRNGHTIFDTDRLDKWINGALRWMCREHPELWFWKVHDTTTFATVTAGTTKLTMPANFNVLILLWNVTGSREVHRRELDDLLVDHGGTAAWNAGAVDYFYELGASAVGADPRSELGLFRPPSASNAFEVMYYRKPATMTLVGDYADFPSVFDDFIVDYAVNQAALFLEDNELVKSTWPLVKEGKKQIARQHQRRIKRKGWIAERLSTRSIRAAGRTVDG